VQLKNLDTKINTRDFEIKQYDAVNFKLTLKSGKSFFVSYGVLIAVKSKAGKITLDKDRWNTSKTTGRYRNAFLNEHYQDTIKHVQTGVYKLKQLNHKL
jgi:hypothetical protein